MAECRGVALAAPASAAAPADKGQYATEAEAKASCPSDVVVWVNSISRIYHASGSRSYGKTRSGAYYVRKGLGGGGVPRAQATGRCDLTSPPAQECFSVVTVPSRHRHRF